MLEVPFATLFCTPENYICSLWFLLCKSNGEHQKNILGVEISSFQNGMSVQAQELFPIWVAIEQRGEQTINRDANTSGRIKSFAADSSAILKWTLNCSKKAENTKALIHLADVNSSAGVY